MEKKVLEFIGEDRWSRPVYKCGENLYVDTDPRPNRNPDICTKANNEFEGEPDWPISKDIEIEFVPHRITW